MRGAYVTAIKSLRSWRDRAGGAREALELEEAILALVEDLSEFERQTGYQEKSFALLQVLSPIHCSV